MYSTIEILFFDLIRVSLGNQKCLSQTPSEGQWRELYRMAKKQSILGICFVGVSKCVNPDEEKYAGMDKALYYEWVGVAMRILQRNESMNLQCVKIQKVVLDNGYRSCILKGQGVATLYELGAQCNSVAMNPALLRQPGDIDLWCDISKETAIRLAEGFGHSEKPGYLHVSTTFGGEHLELHYRPTYLRNPIHNARMQKFCMAHKDDWTERGGMTVPSLEFDVIYQLSHMFRHLFGLGIGMRQLMDYYYLLCAFPKDFNFSDMRKKLKDLGLYRFSRAVMWAMKEVFLMDPVHFVSSPDEKSGRMLLKCMLRTGNFGKMDDKQKSLRGSAIGRSLYKIQQWWRLLRYYPGEVLSDPLWRLINFE